MSRPARGALSVLGLMVSVGLTLGPVRGAVAGLGDFPGGWLHAPASLRAALVARQEPHDAPAVSGAWLAAGQTRLFGMSDLPVRFLALGWASRSQTAPLTMALNLQVTGNSLVKDTLWQGSLGVGQRWHLGLAWSRRQLEIAGTDLRTHDRMVLQAGLPQILGPGVRSRLDLFVPAWDSRPSAQGSQEHNRLLQLEVGQGAESLSLVLESGLQDVPQVTTEMLLGLGPHVAVMVHAEPSTGTTGMGLYLARPGFLLMTSHLVHPVLGVTHRMMVVWGAWEGCRL